MRNSLYYGDNLPVLREHILDELVNLVYLDPPFNSNASDNVLFKERTGEESPAQITALTDTWEWTQEMGTEGRRRSMRRDGSPGYVRIRGDTYRSLSFRTMATISSLAMPRSTPSTSNGEPMEGSGLTTQGLPSFRRILTGPSR
jgi:hypothetical protein